MPSHVIKAFTYDAGARMLEIEFRSGRVYVYEEVPEFLVARMKAAASKGEFFNAHIRDQFAFRRNPSS